MNNKDYFRCEKLENWDALQTEFFDRRLAEYGFAMQPEKEYSAPTHHREQVYVKTLPGHADQPYVTVVATTHWYNLNTVIILLGEGGYQFPEYCFSSIDLQEVVLKRDPRRRTNDTDRYGLYGIPSMAQLPAVVSQAARDLFSYGLDFLEGRMDEFYVMRRQKILEDRVGIGIKRDRRLIEKYTRRIQ